MTRITTDKNLVTHINVITVSAQVDFNHFFGGAKNSSYSLSLEKVPERMLKKEKSAKIEA